MLSKYQNSFLNKKEKEDKEEEKTVADPKADDLPHLPPFNKTIFYTFYLPDFLADLVLIVFSFFVSAKLFSKDGIFTHLQHWQSIAMYCIVTLTIPWYLGYLYVRNSVFYNKIILKIFLWIFILMTLMILVQLMRLVLTDDVIGSDLSGKNGFTAVFAIFLLVLGPMMCMGGAMQADDEFTSKEPESQKFDAGKLAGGGGAFFIIVLAIALMVYIIGLFPENSSFGVIMLGYIGGPILAVIAFALFVGFLQLLDKIGIYKYLRILAINTFPFFIISVLVFWSGVAFYFMHDDFAGASGRISKGAMLFIVMISGLVPFRIVMLFNAPLRLSNIIMGGISLSYFFWQMLSITY